MANICRSLQKKNFFSPVLESPTHIGFIGVRKNGSKIWHLGTFNGQMRNKAHTAPTVPLVLHPTRIEKYATKKFIINGQWQNKLFLIAINCFSLVKAALNAPRVCKLRKNWLTVIDQCAMVLKTPQFLHFSVNIFQVRNEFSPPLTKFLKSYRPASLWLFEDKSKFGIFNQSFKF
jgi:hypothetical protein